MGGERQRDVLNHCTYMEKPYPQPVKIILGRKINILILQEKKRLGVKSHVKKKFRGSYSQTSTAAASYYNISTIRVRG
jgi:hypothetical protein